MADGMKDQRPPLLPEQDDPLSLPDVHATLPPDATEKRSRRLLWALMGAFGIAVVFTGFGGVDLLAQNFLQRFADTATPAVPAASEGRAERSANRSTFAFRDLDIHPDLLYQPYVSGTLLAAETAPEAHLISEFRELLDLYIQRQKIDDNFTIRVVDNRSGDLLELYTLTSEREAYRQEKHADWDAIDRLRRVETRRLVDKHAAQGIPRDAITVKWGRANQIREAHDREAELLEYEMRLVRYLGLSLLVTQIGTVETFNVDHLVSPAGARSRYQMMPYVLRNRGIHHYRLRTASGRAIQVFEEWHPLLTMEPAFLVLRGYANAVGHEITGISAYHTGPGNIFKLYRLFLTESDGLFTSFSSVLDAYVWGVTQGFDIVAANSTFRNHSRGYVPSAYGALKATDELPIDTTVTLQAERVQVVAGKKAYLSQLLRALREAGESLDWGRNTEHMSLYNRFRRINPHFVLPEESDSLGVPVAGDIQLVHEADGATVRFFLPRGASQLLVKAGLTVLDDEARFVYDRSTYLNEEKEETVWDRQYAALVEDITRFGFTNENRKLLLDLADRFEALAEQDPSHYRQAQLQIIRTHKTIWLTQVWEQLADATTAAKGEIRVPVRPPTLLEPTLQPPAMSSPSR